MSINKSRHYLSRIFQPFLVLSKTARISYKEVTSNSQRLMLELGIIHQANPGCFHLLPLGIKSLNKLTKIVEDEMCRIGGQKVMLPSLTSAKLWEASGRLKQAGSELFQLIDRHDHDYVLSPTHEESVTDLIASCATLSYKQYPLRLYQISSKFRDEIKPRFGLMRGREFIMKDMYTFDTDIEKANRSYEEVCECYDNIFNKIGLEYVKVLGTTGYIGGILSHEYHLKAPIGEDKVISCISCNYCANLELHSDETCPKCGGTDFETTNGIEVGHTFLLGREYTKTLHANYISSNGKPVELQMGCFGLGMSRILAASVEILSTDQEMRWPDVLAPYNVVILPPKIGSKEEAVAKDIPEWLYDKIEANIPELTDNVLIDDRLDLTIGRRYVDTRRVGYRFAIIVNSKVSEHVPLFELNDNKSNVRLYLNENDLFKYIKDNIKL